MLHTNNIKSSLYHRRVLVMGLGLHGGGIGVVKWLIAQGAKVTVTDLRSAEQLRSSLRQLPRSSVALVLGRHRLNDFKCADLVVKNPAVPNSSSYLATARAAHVPIVSDIGFFVAACPAPIIGVTGSKGKTTTVRWLEHCACIAKVPVVLGGNVGISPLASLSAIKPNTFVVLELSSWQLEDMAYLKHSPQVAVVTNILPEHLNRYASYNDYAAAKALIVRWQQPTDVAVLNADNARSTALAKKTAGQIWWFSRKPLSIKRQGVWCTNGWWQMRQNGAVKRLASTKQCKIIGEHNYANLAAGATAALAWGLPLSAIKQALVTFTGVADRLELVRTFQKVAWYNDTTATMPDAAVMALQTLHRRFKRVVIIAGGTDKNLRFAGLARALQQHAAEIILLPGSATDKIIAALKRQGSKKTYHLAASMVEAVNMSQKLSKPGDVVVLSPGAASFGLFVHEFDRGKKFCAAVRRLR